MLKITVHEKTGANVEGILPQPVIHFPFLSTILLIILSSAIAVAQPQSVAQQKQGPRSTTVQVR